MMLLKNLRCQHVLRIYQFRKDNVIVLVVMLIYFEYVKRACKMILFKTFCLSPLKSLSRNVYRPVCRPIVDNQIIERYTCLLLH